MMGHILNLILKDIHDELKIRLPLVFEVQFKDGKFTVFQSLMVTKNAKRFTLPSYTETRFYSLGKIFHVVNELFDLIN